MSSEQDPGPETTCEADDTQALDAIRPKAPVAWPPTWAWIILIALAAVTGALLGVHNYSGGASGAGLPASAQRLLAAVTGREPEEDMIFGLSPTPPQQEQDLLPAGVPAVYCFYNMPGVQSGTPPAATWSVNGMPARNLPTSDVKPGDRPGTGMVTLTAGSGGLQPGIYQVELTFPEGRLAGSFVTAVAAEAIAAQAAPKDADVLITQPGFAAGIDANGKPTSPQKAFNGQQKVYFVFRFGQAEPGSAVVVKWYGGEQEIVGARHEVTLPSVEGYASAWLQVPPPGLPDGAYRAAVMMSGDTRELASSDFTVNADLPLLPVPARSPLPQSPPQ